MDKWHDHLAKDKNDNFFPHFFHLLPLPNISIYLSFLRRKGLVKEMEEDEE
jgi:hypothetical protein